MIQIENIDGWGFDHAIRGMRNPMNSWEKSDTRLFQDDDGRAVFTLGENDAGLMHRLFKGGTEHRKFMRQIMVSMDITAPLYWWKEFDTYKVGTTANSCSTMHKIMSKEFVLDDFSHDRVSDPGAIGWFLDTVNLLNRIRNRYLALEDGQEKKRLWYTIIQMLPSSYNQKRTVTMNYEVAASMIRQRTGHKLDEWHVFVEMLWTLPYMDTIINGDFRNGEYADNDTAQSGLASAT